MQIIRHGDKTNLVLFLYILYSTTFPNFLSADSWFDLCNSALETEWQHLINYIRGKKQTSRSGMPLRKRSNNVRKIGPKITSHSAPYSTGAEATNIPHQSKI